MRTADYISRVQDIQRQSMEYCMQYGRQLEERYQNQIKALQEQIARGQTQEQDREQVERTNLFRNSGLNAIDSS